MKIVMMKKGKKVQLGLDRTVIGLPYPAFPKTDGTPLTHDQVQEIHFQQKQFVAKMKHVEGNIISGSYHCKGKNKDLKRYHVQSELNDAALCIVSLGFIYGTGVINFEFNPSKLAPEQFGEIGGLLSVMFSNHYQELYEQGVVSHAEFFADVADEVSSDLVLVDQGRRTTTIYKGTAYSGKQASRLVGTLYNKAKESKIAGELVRVEARINRRDIPFQDLVEQDLFNPFRSLLVVKADALQLVAQKWNSPDLATSLKALGLHGAVANTPARKAIWAFLKEHAVSWWQPDTFWAAHRQLLLKLKPDHAGAFA